MSDTKTVSPLRQRMIEDLERLGRGRLERLQREVRGIHRKVGMSVYEAGAHRPLREIDHSCAGRPTHGPLDPCNPVALDEDLGRARKGIGDTVEHNCRTPERTTLISAPPPAVSKLQHLDRNERQRCCRSPPLGASPCKMRVHGLPAGFDR